MTKERSRVSGVSHQHRAVGCSRKKVQLLAWDQTNQRFHKCLFKLSQTGVDVPKVQIIEFTLIFI